jgi:hypothetical protein
MSRLPILLAALLVVTVAHGKKRSEPPAPPPVGWYAQPAEKKDPGWLGECYFPPHWPDLDLVQRRMARQAALEAMKSQWLGQRDAIVSFDPGAVDELELALLGRPERIEEVTTRNAGFCRAVMAGGSTTDTWGYWLAGLPVQLQAGECRRPLDYQLVQYLRLDVGWQEEIPMCAGDRADIRATTSDRYRLAPGEAWINADGDPERPTLDPALPCSREGCFRGQLIGQFVTEGGVEIVFPIGTRAEFEAPTHGILSFAINDDSLGDNQWHSEGVVTDHTAVTIGPAP